VDIAAGNLAKTFKIKKAFQDVFDNASFHKSRDFAENSVRDFESNDILPAVLTITLVEISMVSHQGICCYQIEVAHEKTRGAAQ
jgi:hypothetical protein